MVPWDRARARKRVRLHGCSIFALGLVVAATPRTSLAIERTVSPNESPKAATLEGNASASEEELADSRHEAPPALPPVPVTEPAPLGRMGKTGVGLLSAGAAGTFLGIAFVVSGSRVNGRVEREGRDLRPAGYVLIGVSLPLAVAGGVLLGVDRRRTRHLQIVPSISRRFVGLSVRGRF